MIRSTCIALSLCAATAAFATPSDSNARQNTRAQDTRAEARAYEYSLKQADGGKRTASTSAAKATVSYPGEITADLPEFTRLQACGGAPTGLGPMHFHVQEVNVDTDGAYDITSVQTDFDGFLFLYENAFDPNAPATNCFDFNDDGGAGIGTSEMFAVPLVAANDYFIVTTTFENGELGSFVNTIDGPGEITLPGFVPADLSIVKTAPDGVNADASFTYVLSAANAGPEPATDVVVTDVLPGAVTFVDSDCGATAAGNTVTWAIGAMALGDVATCTITVDPVDDVCVTVSNTATIDSAESDPVGSNNSSTASNTGANIVLDPSFETSLDDNIWTQASANFGTPICDVVGCGGVGGGTGPRTGDFWVWFGGFDEGVETASVEQSVTIASDMAQLSFWFESTVCDPTNGAGDFARLTIDGDELWRVDASGPACGTVGYAQVAIDISAYADDAAHTVRFESETLGSAIAGDVTNFFIEDVEIFPAPVCNVAASDVSVTLVAAPEPALAGGPLTYSSVLSNAGPLDALDVTYSLPLPTGVTFTSITADPALTCTTPAVDANGTIECSVALLGAAEDLAIEVVAGIDITVAADFSATATVETSSTESNTSNNEATPDTTLADAADLSVSIDDGAGGVLDGDEVVYLLVVTNNGPTTATDAALTTTLSANLTDVAWTCTGVGATCPTAAGTGNIAALATLTAGASLEYEITATVDLSVSATPTTATADIAPPAGLPDPDTSNNTDTDTNIILTIGIFSDGFED